VFVVTPGLSHIASDNILVIGDRCVHSFLLMADRLLALDVRHRRNTGNERTRLLAVVRVWTDEVVREARLELDDRLQVLDILARQLDVKRLDVVLQVLDLPATDDREDVGCLGHDICESDGGWGVDTVGLSDLVKRFGDVLLVL
jgi:hypothetical protein